MVKGSPLPARNGLKVEPSLLKVPILCPEEDQNILVETSAKFSARFLAGIEEPFTVSATTS